MKTKIDQQLSSLPMRAQYEEGSTLMNRATEKIAGKYNLAVLCMTSRSDQPDHTLHMQNMSVETMALFLVSLLTEAKNKKFINIAKSKVPDLIWMKALGWRFALFYVAMGAGAWAGIELGVGFLKHLSFN